MDTEVASVDGVEFREGGGRGVGAFDCVAVHPVGDGCDVGLGVRAFPASVCGLGGGGVLHGVGVDVVDAREDLFAESSEDAVEATVGF